MIRVDALWLACEPFDMRAGTETALARAVAVFGEAKPHHAYLFANRRATRMKVLVHDGNESDVEQIADLLHGEEQRVWADSGYRGAQARLHRETLQWHIAARPSDIAKLPDGRGKKAMQTQEHRKASVRAKVEHPFRVSSASSG